MVSQQRIEILIHRIVKLYKLNAFAVEFRYPGQSADRDTARQAVNICKQARNVMKQSLGLD